AGIGKPSGSARAAGWLDRAFSGRSRLASRTASGAECRSTSGRPCSPSSAWPDGGPFDAGGRRTGRGVAGPLVDVAPRPVTVSVAVLRVVLLGRPLVFCSTL